MSRNTAYIDTSVTKFVVTKKAATENYYIDTYVLLAILKDSVCLQPADFNTIAYGILGIQPVTVTNTMFDQHYAPTMAEYVQALIRMGFSRQSIQEQLSLSQQMVSYYAKQPVTRMYFNPALHEYIRPLELQAQLEVLRRSENRRLQLLKNETRSS